MVKTVLKYKRSRGYERNEIVNEKSNNVNDTRWFWEKQ